MPENNTYTDPGADLAIALIDKMINNGASEEMKAIGEGLKASIKVSCNNNTKISTHINDENVHTAKGIATQKGVLKWLVGGMFGISMLVQYVPDIVKWFVGLF